MACPPRGDRSTVAADNCIFAQPHAKFVCDYLRLHRHSLTRGPVMHDFSPVLHTLLRFLQKASVFLPLKMRQQIAKNSPAVSDQPHFDGESQTNAFGIKLDLHSLGL